MPRRTASSFSRRAFLGVGLGSLAYAAQPEFPALAAQDPELLTFFRIGTGPTAEALYSLGTAISAGISRPPGSSPCDAGGICGVPGLIAVAQSRSGSISSIRDLRDGELESALVHSDIAYWAKTERGPFTDEPGIPDLRLIANVIPVDMHIVVRAESQIQSVQDLQWRRISVGPEDSGILRFVKVLLRSYGLEMTDVSPKYLRPGPAADALLSGEIDAFFDMGAAPVEAIAELHEEMPIRLLPLDQPALQTLRTFFPFLRSGDIEDSVYSNVAGVTTASLGVQWVARAQTDPQLIESITRAFWQSDTADLFIRNNPGHFFPPVDLASSGSLIPLHDGASKYYETIDVAPVVEDE